MAQQARFAVSAAVILILTSVAFPQHYTIQDLGALPDLPCTAAADMSAQRVVGTSGYCGAYFHAFLWSPKAGLQDLGALPGGNYSQGYGVNSHGVVVGEAVGLANDNYYIHAFSWTRATGMRDLGILPGGTYSRATGINGSGLIVGYGDFPNAGTFTHAILWSQSGMTDLGAITGQTESVAAAISHDGDVVGDAGGIAALWRADGTYWNLGTLPGGYASRAVAISGHHIVGWSNSTGLPRAFLWTKTKGMRDLGLLPNGTLSVATGVDGRRVVGYGDNSGFIWTPEGGMKNLNDLIVNGAGSHVTFASDINSAGQIAAIGNASGDSKTHSFLLTPVP